jgi:sugar lactone lactonase YvrE
MRKPELVLDAKALLGEGPCWDSERKCLYWVDILGCKLHKYIPEGSESCSVELGIRVSAVVPGKKNDLILAAEHGFFMFDLLSGCLRHICSVELHLPQNRFNDGKCDPAGRFWAGSLGPDKQAALYCLDRNMKAVKVLDGIGCSNGLCWSPDSKTMYYIDTTVREVWAFDYDINTGAIDNKRTVLTINEGVPDGMTIDTEGMLWIAQWGAWKVCRYNPFNGKCLEEITLPVSQPSSCTFGGPQLNELYITSARVSLDESELEKQPLAGGLFKVNTGVQGFKATPFGNGEEE